MKTGSSTIKGYEFTSGKSGTFRIDPQELYGINDLRDWLIADTNSPGAPLITRKAKHTMSHIDDATKTIEEANAMFLKAHGNLQKTEADIAAQSKKVSGAVRDAHQKLSDGLERLTKTADIPRLEKHVELLERAAAAMQVLAELDKTGHLSKFATAMK
jgi:hypothetical protein